MPILATPGCESDDGYDVISSPGADSASPPLYDENVMAEVSSTHEIEETDDGDAGSPKKRGPKKQPMTRARLAKVKVRSLRLRTVKGGSQQMN